MIMLLKLSGLLFVFTIYSKIQTKASKIVLKIFKRLVFLYINLVEQVVTNYC